MIDFIAEFVGGIIELVIDLLFEPWISKLAKRRKQKKTDSFKKVKGK